MINTQNQTFTTEQLKEKLVILVDKISSLEHQNAELTAKLNWFEEQFRLHQHRLFGRSSEQTIADQQTFFNEAEALDALKPIVPELTVEEITYKRKKRQGHREEMLKDLPVETIEYRLSEEELICKQCEGILHEMSKEIRREIKFIPAKVTVIEHIRYVYGCRNCEKNDITTPITTAPMPKPALPGSPASASAIAYVMVQKFMYGLPLYRQEQQWKQLDIEISRQTMANWIIQASNRWLTPLFERMHQLLLQYDIVHADETTLQVLHEPERSADSKSYMWLYRTGRDGPPIILYEYQTTRAKKHPEKFLTGFKGYLCTDGYAGYNNLPEIIAICCFAHYPRCMIIREGMPKAEEIGKALNPSQIIIMKQSA